MESIQCNDVTISGSGVAIFPSEVNHFPKHLPSGSSFLITGGSARLVEIVISARVGVVVLVVDISESDIIHRPHEKTAVTLKTPVHAERLMDVGKKDKDTSAATVSLDVRQAVCQVLSFPAVEMSKGLSAFSSTATKETLPRPQLFEAPLAPFPLPHPHPLHNEETQRCISPLSLP